MIEGNRTVSPPLAERRAGVCLHITSLPGRYGIGEAGDEARAFVDSLARMGIGVWQFLPLGPTGYGDSPYQPLSTIAGNEMLIDMATIIRAGLATSSEADSLLSLPSKHVDYSKLIPLKSALLSRAVGRFHVQADSDVKAAFDRFLEENNDLWLHDYALFRVLKSMHEERAWPAWSPDYASRDRESIRKVEAGAAQEIENWKILQFLLSRQWQRLHEYAADRNVALFGDMPFYVSLDSADTWANRDILSLDEKGRPNRVAGVPPDYFSEDGQLWGNPVYDWDYHARTSYRWWIDRLRLAADQCDFVRIDHFRGFESYWSVPSDAETARDGEWHEGPGDGIFEAIRSSLGSLPIVAEDLGVITEKVDALRERHEIPGMKVLQFEIARDDFAPDEIEPGCVCYTGTHDNDTTVGWFRGGSNDTRSPADIRKTQRKALELTGGSVDTIHADMIRLAFATQAQIAIAPLQDYLGLGSEARMNIPGTTDANWRWRVTSEQLTPAFLDSVRQLVEEANRLANA